MSKLHLTADLGFNEGKYHVGLSLIEFEEENVIIIYSPALDLSGYGYSQEEAKSSFSEALKEFFRYTSNKNSLKLVLENLGWLINGSKKKPRFNPPKDSELVVNNPVYNDIVNNKSYKVSREEVEFAF
jgi:GTP-binding protein EngB required for normal cell division